MKSICTIASIALARTAFSFSTHSSFAFVAPSLSLPSPLSVFNPIRFVTRHPVPTRLRSAAGNVRAVGTHPVRTEKHPFQISIPSSGTSALSTRIIIQTDSAVIPGDINNWNGEMLVIPLFEPDGDDKEKLASLDDRFSAFDAKLDGALSDLIATSEFKGKPGTSSTVRLGKSSPIRKLALVGVGKKDKFGGPGAIKLGAFVAGAAKTEKAKKMGVVLPEGTDGGCVGSMAEAVALGLSIDNRFKTGEGKDKLAPLQTLDLLGPVPPDSAAQVERGLTMAESVRLAKDLVGAPANVVTPTELARTAQAIASESPASLKLEILEKEECARRGMGAYLGVSQGATEPPKFIHLTYTPPAAKGPIRKRVAVIGKGVTFDSGGYNLKAGAGSMIELMKFDMGGSAATLGAAQAVAALQPPGVEAHFIVAACENMVSAEAMRPGDILTASNGKTIEVINTDAEGRLTLADALVFAEKAGAEAIVDIATLTGSVIVALGDEYAGLWSNNDTLAEQIKASAKASGEKLWHMPLCDEYGEATKSKLADLKNVGGKGGGAITAALFLKEFAGKAAWAHIDMAGPVWNDKAGGATGFGVRTLTHWVCSQGLP